MNHFTCLKEVSPIVQDQNAPLWSEDHQWYQLFTVHEWIGFSIVLFFFVSIGNQLIYVFLLFFPLIHTGILFSLMYSIIGSKLKSAKLFWDLFILAIKRKHLIFHHATSSWVQFKSIYNILKVFDDASFMLSFSRWNLSLIHIIFCYAAKGMFGLKVSTMFFRWNKRSL